MTNLNKYPAIIPEPPLLRQYHRALALAIESATEIALSRMQPVVLSRYTGASEVGINRRRRNAKGKMSLAPNPNGFYNPDLWVLELRSAKPPGQGKEGIDRAVLFSYGCHPVIVYGFAWDGISAGYPGAARRALQAQLGDHIHCQFLQGLAGNVRPRVLADAAEGVFRKSTPQDVTSAGQQLASDVVQALRQPPEPVHLALQARAGWVNPRRDLDRVPSLAHWEAMAKQDDELSRNVGRFWARRISSGCPLPSALPMEIGLLQIAAGHRIAWFNTEAVAEWLPLLRSWLDDPALTVWGYCQEVSTYLPTDELLSEGGYEVIQAPWYDAQGPSPFAPGINVTVRHGFEALAQRWN
jgi:neutral ceramidase